MSRWGDPRPDEIQGLSQGKIGERSRMTGAGGTWPRRAKLFRLSVPALIAMILLAWLLTALAR